MIVGSEHDGEGEAEGQDSIVKGWESWSGW